MLGAAGAGAVALVLWGDAWAVVGCAALGAALGGFLGGHAPAPVHEQPPAAPTPEDAALPELDPLLDALPLGILVIGAGSQIERANPMARELFGLPDQPELPMAVLRVRRLLECIGAALEQGTSATLDFTMTRGAEVLLKSHIRAIGPEGARKAVVAIQDETSARRAHALHRDFVANASHELKTPLAVVSGVIETLQGAARHDPAASERFLSLMAAQNKRMTRLVEDLLSLNRIEQNERMSPSARIDVTGVIAEVVDTLRPVAEQTEVNLVLERPARVPEVLADRDEIGQLMQNLIDNAIKYGGSGSVVTVTVRAKTDPSPGWLAITVSDTGRGIPKADLPRLTERFYRVDESRSREQGGTGLGLAIVKHIVSRHRGKLEIESALGEGAEFTVLIPIPPGAPNGAETESTTPTG